MTKDKCSIHFGYFLRHERDKLSLSIRRMADLIGITEKRLWQIEQKPTPDVSPDTFAGIATALKLTPEQLREKWQATPVVTPERKRPDPRAGLLRVGAVKVQISKDDLLSEVRRLGPSLSYADVRQLRLELRRLAQTKPSDRIPKVASKRPRVAR